MSGMSSLKVSDCALFMKALRFATPKTSYLTPEDLLKLKLSPAQESRIWSCTTHHLLTTTALKVYLYVYSMYTYACILFMLIQTKNS